MMIKKIIFYGLLLYVAGQNLSMHAMLMHRLRSLVATSSNLSTQYYAPSLACNAEPNALFNLPTQQRRMLNNLLTPISTVTNNSQPETLPWWKRWYGTLVVLAGLGTTCEMFKKQKAHSNETPKQDPLYYNDFLKRAGFHEALPYWYLAAYAKKMNDIPLREGLQLRIISRDNVSTYQPYYLGDEIIPVWTGSYWDTDGGRVYGPGIIIEISDAHYNEVASCELSGAGKVNNVQVAPHVRGKGYGTLLLSTVKKLASEAGIKELYVHVYPYRLSDYSNWQKAFDLTVSFYQKNGFVGDYMFDSELAKQDNQNTRSDYSRMVCTLSA